MISLSCYLTPIKGKEKELDSAIRDVWIKRMIEQPGYLKAVWTKSAPKAKLAEIGAEKTLELYDVTAYWRTEAERYAWQIKPIHLEAWTLVVSLCSSVQYTLSDVVQSWDI